VVFALWSTELMLAGREAVIDRSMRRANPRQEGLTIRYFARFLSKRALATEQRRGDLVSVRLGAVLGVCCAGEITNVTEPFQPASRSWLANSQ
jgi:hypothetical protein